MRGYGNWLRLGIGALVVAGLVAVYAAGLDQALSPEAVRDRLLEAGLWGPVIFCAFYALGELVAFPSAIFVIVAGMTWGIEQALVVAWIGSVISATLVFLVARYVARDWVQVRMPPWMNWIDRWIERRAIVGVALLRLVAFLAPWTHVVLAVSRVGIRDYVLGTAIGVIPGLVALVWLGEQALDSMTELPAWVWLIIPLLIALNLLRRGRSRDSVPELPREAPPEA